MMHRIQFEAQRKPIDRPAYLCANCLWTPDASFRFV